MFVLLCDQIENNGGASTRLNFNSSYFEEDKLFQPQAICNPVGCAILGEHWKEEDRDLIGRQYALAHVLALSGFLSWFWCFGHLMNWLHFNLK